MTPFSLTVLVCFALFAQRLLDCVWPTNNNGMALLGSGLGCLLTLAIAWFILGWRP